MKSMNSEELRQLKPGDVVYLGKNKATVEKVGRKWINLGRERIDIERARTSHPNYTQYESGVWRTLEEYEAYNDYCNSADDARRTISHFISRATHKDAIKVAEFIKSLGYKKGA